MGRSQKPTFDTAIETTRSRYKRLCEICSWPAMQSSISESFVRKLLSLLIPPHCASRWLIPPKKAWKASVEPSCTPAWHQLRTFPSWGLERQILCDPVFADLATTNIPKTARRPLQAGLELLRAISQLQMKLSSALVLVADV